MSSLAKQHHREHEKLRRINAEARRLLEDLRAWNRMHPRSRPMDETFDRTVMELSAEAIAALRDGKKAAFTEASEKLRKFAETAEAGGVIEVRAVGARGIGQEASGERR